MAHAQGNGLDVPLEDAMGRKSEINRSTWKGTVETTNMNVEVYRRSGLAEVSSSLQDCVTLPHSRGVVGPNIPNEVAFARVSYMSGTNHEKERETETRMNVKG